MNIKLNVNVTKWKQYKDTTEHCILYTVAVLYSTYMHISIMKKYTYSCNVLLLVIYVVCEAPPHSRATVALRVQSSNYICS